MREEAQQQQRKKDVEGEGMNGFWSNGNGEGVGLTGETFSPGTVSFSSCDLPTDIDCVLRRTVSVTVNLYYL